MKAERDRARGHVSTGSASSAAGDMSYPQQAGSPELGGPPVMYPAQGATSPQGGNVGGLQQPQMSQVGQQAYGAQGGYGAGQGVAPGQPGQYEMQQVGNAPPMGAGGSMNDFFAEIESISQMLASMKGNVNQINTLHTTVLNSATNEARQEQASKDLEAMTIETSRLTNPIKIRIQNLSELNDKQAAAPGNEGERNTRRMQVAVQKKKFMDLIQEYREVEAKSREKYRSRMERQYKVVKPDATPEEIRTAIETDGGQQVFANALTQSTRYADARNAYREVQERHEDIKRIAETMTQLQQLFQDMANLVERQDEAIQTIEASANDVEANMQAGNQQIDKGVVKAKKARRKRVICFWVLIIIIIALALGITLGILSKNGTI